MVKIAIIGGSSNVGSEVHDVLVARGKHEIILLSRKDAPAQKLAPGVQWVKTDYEVAHLTKILGGVETVLSFVSGPADPTNTSQSDTQKNLIDACIQAGVKRFAPSEWATSKFDHLFWYSFKQVTRDYLAEVNKEKKVLEYCLFQPGLFTNYLTYPFSSSKHVTQLETPVDFNQCRALVVDGGEDVLLTFTTAQDLARVVALAVEYEGEWPLVGGIKGAEITVRQLISLGEKIRGKPFAIEKLKKEDLEASKVTSSWTLEVKHPSIPPETRKAVAASLLSGILLGFSAGCFNTSSEWNQLLPDFKFTQPEEFLSQAWKSIEAGENVVFDEY
ncbi:Oxidoreductase BOA1 [Colletotrichum fructicola]|nr:Oxidoreductase BOA1 [Colletotrichum fructicola]KAF4926376.1 Oxidoreductase BOA1 [Colletotrichum fructicola]KAF5493450.1 Oxidoreductase BOA1 [Colletotrichum fructicola]